MSSISSEGEREDIEAASILAASMTTTKSNTASNGGARRGISEKKKKPPRDNGKIDPNSETITHENRWNVMFERLKQYKQVYGNCLVPNRYPGDTQLGSWVSAQRRQYKVVTSGSNESAAMTPERALKLREIGFEWTTCNPRNVPWEQRYEELRAFVAEFGHAEVPMRWEENPKLSNWVSKQRHQYKLMQMARPSRLNKAKVKLLDDIGFVWEASRRRLDECESDDSGSVPPKKRQKQKQQTVGFGSVIASPNLLTCVPKYTEPRRGRLGMDPPADPPAAGEKTDLISSRAAQNPVFAAQAMMMNPSMWPVASGQPGGAASFMPPSMNHSMGLAAVAADPSGRAMNSAMFYHSAAMAQWNTMMPRNAVAGLLPAFVPAQMPVAMTQSAGMAVPSRSGSEGGKINDPPTDDEGGVNAMGSELDCPTPTAVTALKRGTA